MGKFTKRSVQYAKTAGLDACEVNILFYFDFVGEGFGKAFDGLCEGAVDLNIGTLSDYRYGPERSGIFNRISHIISYYIIL